MIRAASLEDLQLKPVVVKHAQKQIVLFLVEGVVHAIDNRCPHEGYPLAAGQLSKDCVLTCTWHNWKFRLETGECLIGGDDVRVYPTTIENGYAWVDVADPPLEDSRRRTLSGLKAAFEERDFGRICREIARLHYFGLNPSDAVASALEWAHDRLEFGTTHSIAGAADWLLLAASYPEDFENRLICLSEAVDHLASDSLRHSPHPYAPAGKEVFQQETFRAAVEEEDASRAEAMVARGLTDGLHWPDMEEAFCAAAFAHYNDFGHSVIYVFKTGELIEALGPTVERTLLLPLARHLCYTTREDLLPEFKHYKPALASLDSTQGTPAYGGAFDVPFPSNTATALEWLGASLKNQTIDRVYDRLLEALALNLLFCDTSYETKYNGPVSENIGWLDFTHGITMANAARNLCSRYPQFWKPALAQMACFLGRNHDFIDRSVDRNRWDIENTNSFFREIREQLFDHGYRDPIFAVHLLKTSMAVANELPPASPSCRSALLAALHRFFKSPMKTKHVRRTARQAIRLVSRDFL
jgi:nitrite reductase/ring-hydroxylating ferredoxin subunit